MGCVIYESIKEFIFCFINVYCHFIGSEPICNFLQFYVNSANKYSQSTIAVSSAKSNASSSVVIGKSLIKQRKSIGPRILPWSTEMSSGLQVEVLPLISDGKNIFLLSRKSWWIYGAGAACFLLLQPKRLRFHNTVCA